MKVYLDEGAYMPERAHELDAGLDLRAREDCIIKAGGSAVFDTGVHVEIPPGCVGMLKSKSGLNTFHGIVSEGVIDAGYTGSIVAKLYNHSDEDFIVYKGDKITQLVCLPIFRPVIWQVDNIDWNSERGSNGFGSSGR